MVKELYWYKNGDQIISSHDQPPRGTPYVKKIIGIIGVPDMRAVSIKDSNGKLLYNSIENIPLEDDLIETYLMKGGIKL